MPKFISYNTLSICLSEYLWDKWREKTKKNAIYPGKYHLALTNANSIKLADADVVHLQEADKYLISQLFEICPDYNFYFEGEEIKEAPFHNSHGLLTMVKNSFEIRRIGVFAIAEGRNAQYIAIQEKSPDSETILCINAHFPIRANREYCASQVIKFMNSREEQHVVFSGDLNTFDADSEVIAIFQKYNILKPHTPTFRPWPCDSYQNESILDYAATDGKFATSSTDFVELFGYDFAASDHAMIKFSINWN